MLSCMIGVVKGTRINARGVRVEKGALCLLLIRVLAPVVVSLERGQSAIDGGADVFDQREDAPMEQTCRALDGRPGHRRILPDKPCRTLLRKPGGNELRWVEPSQNSWQEKYGLVDGADGQSE